MLLIAIALTTSFSTLTGGLFALRLKDRLHLVLGFSVGAVIAVAFFDLLPEAIEVGQKYQDAKTVLTWAAVGFLLYLILDRVVLFRGSADAAHNVDHTRQAGRRGVLGAASLSIHSFLDGVAIGFAFDASAAVGLAVTVAVLTHDFSDGINTVNIVLKNGGTRPAALRWLAVDAMAPVAGIASTTLFTVPENIFGDLLALFAGFFLYIGASDLIPESQHAHPKLLTTFMTLVGAAVLYLAVTFAGL